MAGRQLKNKKQKSREAAVDKLMKEITGVRKTVDDFLKTTRSAERSAALLTAAYPAVRRRSDHTYEAYQCICIRLKVLQGLLESMDDTAKRLGNENSYLN